MIFDLIKLMMGLSGSISQERIDERTCRRVKSGDSRPKDLKSE